MGANNYSSQVVQHIDPAKPAQNLGALFNIVEEYHPGFRQEAAGAYPELGDELQNLPRFDHGAHSVREGVATAAEVPNGRWEVSADALGNMDGLLGMAEPAFRAMVALRAGMHVIFTGPPGTGKTHLAEFICKANNYLAWTVPATDQWTTFETIGGYFPSPASSLSEECAPERLDFLPGAIVDAISRGRILIVDEINRADIDKAFGEMFTLLAGNSVTLPYRRRGADGFLRIRLQADDAPPEADIDVIPLPSWWRLIGTMNDADKSSLKRLSLAFVRRFAFIPVGLPEAVLYQRLLTEYADGLFPGASTHAALGPVLESVKEMFCSVSTGFAAVGNPMGPAIPMAMIRQAVREVESDRERGASKVLASILDLYVSPQLQGRADLHGACESLYRHRISDESLANACVRSLAIWTGYDT